MANRTVAGRRNPSAALRRYEVMVRSIDAAASLAQTGMICGTFLGCFYLLYKVLLAYAGTSTFANVAISVATNFHFDQILSFGVGVSGFGYGLRQKKLRQGNIERLAARNADLERRIDPRRSSSGLTPRGTTQPGDR